MVVERESVGDSIGKEEEAERDSSEKRFIIVQTLQTDGNEGPEEICYSTGLPYLKSTGYYILDLHTGNVLTLPRTVQDQGPMSDMVAFGSKIYIFGRPIKNSDSTTKPPSSSYFLDMTDFLKSQSPSPSWNWNWKRDYPLNTDQFPIGSAVPFGGKMYFFRNSDDLSCCCEVFDPSQPEPEPQWCRIKSTPTPTPAAAQNKIDPTDGTPIATPVLADYKNNRIIVFISNISSLYAYYPYEDRWDCLVDCFLLFGVRNWFLYLQPVTIVDGIIYFHPPKHPYFFEAFDLATKKWLNVTVSPEAVHPYKFYLPIRFYSPLLHLGNDLLCLLASTYKDRESDPQTQTTLVHVVQFKVKLIDNNGTKEVIVTPLPSLSRYYDLDSRCALFRGLSL